MWRAGWEESVAAVPTVAGLTTMVMVLVDLGGTRGGVNAPGGGGRLWLTDV